MQIPIEGFTTDVVSFKEYTNIIIKNVTPFQDEKKKDGYKN